MNTITQNTTASRTSEDVDRLAAYLRHAACLTPQQSAKQISEFGAGRRFVLPDVSTEISDDNQWKGHAERADLIAKHGLYGSEADAAEGERFANAPLIAERRKALSEGFLDFGATASARADELAADLSISVAQAMATLKAENAERALPSDYLTVAQRAEGAPEMGGDMNDVFSGSAKSQSNKMSAAIDRAAGIKEGNLK